MTTIDILEKKIDIIDASTIWGGYQVIKGHIEVRFLLNGIFYCNVKMNWQDGFENDLFLAEKILSKIYDHDN